MRPEFRHLLWFGPVGALLIAAALAGWHHKRSASFAVAPPEIIASGRQIYAEQCASCHGADLKGQPDWMTPLASGRLPAPPHDASGHTWHHADDILFSIVKDGTAAYVGGTYESDMPGFAPVLSDAEINAVLAFIKNSWPKRERDYQRQISRDN